MLKKVLLPTVVISATLLGGFGALLYTQGSKPVQIQLENRQVFDGRLKDIVSPAVGALLTIGVTAATASVLAWHHSARESSKLEKRLSQLQTEISYKDAQINELKVAPTSPMLSSLDWFLDKERVTSSVPQKTTKETIKETVKEISLPEVDPEVIPEPVLQPVLSMRPATKPMVPMSSVSYRVITTTQPELQTAEVQNATNAFPSAQSVLGLTKPYRQAETAKTQASIR